MKYANDYLISNDDPNRIDDVDDGTYMLYLSYVIRYYCIRDFMNGNYETFYHFLSITLNSTPISSVF